MRTIKILIIIAAFFSFSFILNAQDTTKPFYFPHKTGDMREYFYYEFGTPYTDTVQHIIISDSIDSGGTKYYTQYARKINPVIGGSYFFLDTTNFVIDTSYNVYGPSYDYKNRLVYKLNAEKGDQWVLYNYNIGGGNLDYEIARVKDKWKETLFGKETSFMLMHYFAAYDSTDTLGLDRYWDEIADGFGLVYRYPAEYFGEIHLIGAIINGIQYGDTTLVSVKNMNNFLPLSIRLNQNYPNPFNPQTAITFRINKLTNISLIIYDLIGKEVYKLINNQEFIAGEYNVVWNGIKENGIKAASGIYFYRLISDELVLTRSMVLIK